MFSNCFQTVCVPDLFEILMTDMNVWQKNVHPCIICLQFLNSSQNIDTLSEYLCVGWSMSPWQEHLCLSLGHQGVQRTPHL